MQSSLLPEAMTIRWALIRDATFSTLDVSSFPHPQVNKICMWRFKDREEEPEYTRSMTEPELIDPKLVCEYDLSSGLTDLCFLDERYMVASLKDGVVVLLEFLDREVCMLEDLGFLS